MLVLRGQFGLQFVGLVEMVFDRALGAPRNEDHLGNACCCGFLHRILDQRLVHDGQHFLRAGFRGGQETRAEPRHGKHGLGDLFVHDNSIGKMLCHEQVICPPARSLAKQGGTAIGRAGKPRGHVVPTWFLQVRYMNVQTFSAESRKSVPISASHIPTPRLTARQSAPAHVFHDDGFTHPRDTGAPRSGARR